MPGFILPINHLVGFADEIQDLKVYLERLEDVYDYPGAHENPNRRKRRSGRSERKTLRAPGNPQRVSFGYSRLEPPLIEGFSMTLKPGEHVAIVGGTGSGKSTLAKLIAGLVRTLGWRNPV